MRRRVFLIFFSLRKDFAKVRPYHTHSEQVRASYYSTATKKAIPLIAVDRAARQEVSPECQNDRPLAENAKNQTCPSAVEKNINRAGMESD